MSQMKTHSTPLPSGYRDMAEEYQAFSQKVCARLEAGAKEYGDSSFTRPEAEVLGELQQELEDIAGWGFILWARVERMKRKLDQ